MYKNLECIEKINDKGKYNRIQFDNQVADKLYQKVTYLPNKIKKTVGMGHIRLSMYYLGFRNT